jgi:glycosyltransferase involved in cell wall biosynthesis
VKGVDVLIEAVAKLIDEGMRPTCYLIGQGPLGRSLDRQARLLGIEGRVRQLGPLPLDRLPDWYRSADVLVLPSHSEGVPSVLVEASACGTPYVASRVGGIPEIAHLGRGRLVAPGEASLLARAIREAVDDTPPPAEVPASFRSYDDVASDLTDLFEAVVGQDRRSRRPATEEVAR